MKTESPSILSRRTLLRTSLVGIFLLGARALYPTEAYARKFPEGWLSLYNVNTDERLTLRYRNSSGRYDRSALKDLNYLFRCHYSNQTTTMDIRMIEFLNAVEKRLGGRQEIHIVSGYRSPEYDALLVRQGKGAAKRSLHMVGKAVDIQIPGVHPARVREAALRLKCGGVGYYPRKRFIHLDSGSFRWW